MNPPLYTWTGATQHFNENQYLCVDQNRIQGRNQGHCRLQSGPGGGGLDIFLGHFLTNIYRGFSITINVKVYIDFEIMYYDLYFIWRVCYK